MHARPRRGRATARRSPSAARPGAPPSTLLAAIDVGSHALRLAVGEATPGRPLRQLESLHSPVAIGLDTFSRGAIRSVTTDAVVNTLRDFANVLSSYGIARDQLRAVATTAVRDARNRDVFLDRVEQGCGLRIEVIEAVEETRLLYQYIRHQLGTRFDAGTCMLLSLGGGGTQIIIQRDGEIVFGETRHFGMLQLWGARPTERMAVAAARAFLGKEVRALERLQNLREVSSMIVINRELYQLLDCLAEVERSDAGIELQRRELLRLHAQLESLPTDQLQARAGMDFGSAEMARIALEELRAFSDATSATTITLSGASMLDCLLLDARRKMEGVAADQLTEQIESAALALGRKYRFDEQHARHVRGLALQLFDTLRHLHHLPPHSRLLLGIACMLHDIGYFVSPHGHERHSSYLIAASEIIGLSRPDLDCVAMVARYHRRPFAEIDSFELSRLHATDRVEVLKLAALMRLADALDDDRLQRVERVEVELTPEVLRIFAETRAGDREGFSSIAESFRVKADLFGETFGLEPTLTEVLAR
jgi:exopolyphosphatase / guanosine-5'-triphosphate,3'-diphosphate pyrophosphatase